MKILIPLTIPVLSFIIYYFFNNPATESRKKDEKIALSTEPVTIKQKHKMPHHDYLSNVATVETLPSKNIKTTPAKDYLTLNDLRKNRQLITQSVQTLSQTQSYDQMVFEQLKHILEQSSSTYYAKKHIVLNSHISSILTSLHAKERFKELLSSDFGLDEETIKQEMKDKRTVWDWVIFLSPQG